MSSQTLVTVLVIITILITLPPPISMSIYSHGPATILGSTDVLCHIRQEAHLLCGLFDPSSFMSNRPIS